MGSLGPFEILAILVVVLLLFGAKRIPEIARGLGKGIREFKDATNDIKQELTVEPPRRQPLPPSPPATAQPSQPVTVSQAPPAPAPEPPPDAQTQA